MSVISNSWCDESATEYRMWPQILHCLVSFREIIEKFVTPAIQISMTFQNPGPIPGLFRICTNPVQVYAYL